MRAMRHLRLDRVDAIGCGLPIFDAGKAARRQPMREAFVGARDRLGVLARESEIDAQAGQSEGVRLAREGDAAVASRALLGMVGEPVATRPIAHEIAGNAMGAQIALLDKAAEKGGGGGKI